MFQELPFPRKRKLEEGTGTVERLDSTSMDAMELEEGEIHEEEGGSSSLPATGSNMPILLHPQAMPFFPNHSYNLSRQDFAFTKPTPLVSTLHHSPLPSQHLHMLNEATMHSVEYLMNEVLRTITSLTNSGLTLDYLREQGISAETLQYFHDPKRNPPNLHQASSRSKTPPSRTPSTSHSTLSSRTNKVDVDGPALAAAPGLSTTNGVGDIPSHATKSVTKQENMQLEMEKRQELLRRKVALSVRNNQKAKLLQSELETLFAETHQPQSLNMPFSQTSTVLSTPASESSAGTSRAANFSEALPADSSPVQSELRTRAVKSVNGRPRAVDLGADPAEASSSWRGNSYMDANSRKHPQLVIEISDSEPEDDSQEDGGDSSNDEEDDSDIVASLLLPAKSDQPPLQLAVHETKSKHSSREHSPGLKYEVTPNRKSKTQLLLEEKEIEIKLIMEKIALRELQKKNSRALNSPNMAPATKVVRKSSQDRQELKTDNTNERAPMVSNKPSTHADPIADTTTAEEISQHLTSLQEQPLPESTLDGGSKKIPNFEISTVLPAANLPKQISDPKVAELTTAVKDSSIYFRPYRSPLEQFPGLRSQSNSLSEARSQGLLKLSAETINRRMCKYEVGGGHCTDTACKSVHFSSFAASP